MTLTGHTGCPLPTTLRLRCPLTLPDGSPPQHAPWTTHTRFACGLAVTRPTRQLPSIWLQVTTTHSGSVTHVARLSCACAWFGAGQRLTQHKTPATCVPSRTRHCLTQVTDATANGSPTVLQRCQPVPCLVGDQPVRRTPCPTPRYRPIRAVRVVSSPAG